MSQRSPAAPHDASHGSSPEVAELRQRIADLERQVADYRQLSERLGNLPGDSGGDAQLFFPALVRTLADSLQADYVLVGEFNPQADVIRAPAIYARGQVTVGDQYALAGTPCNEVVGKRECIFADCVRERFPHDKQLIEWEVESYAGVPLFDSHGAAVGLVAAMWTRPLEDPEAARSILALFAARATREIERIRADRALRASEARFRTLCQASPMGIFECDERGLCTYISTPWETRTGRTNEELQGYGWAKFIHPDDIGAAREKWRANCRDRRIYFDEFRIVLQSGEVRWARAVAKRMSSVAGEKANYVGCIEDVTDRKQAELAQRQSEERFHAFMDNSPAIAFMKDSAGRRVYANLPYLQQFQVGDEDVLGKTDYEMFDADLARKLAINDERVLTIGGPVQTIEAVPTADGVLRRWLVYKFPVEAPSGERYIGGVAIDISDRLRVEEQLRKAHAEMERRVAERTASLTAANARLQQEILERESADTALRGEQILLRRLLFRHEADRKLIAYELHDGPVQYVTAALMHLETARAASANLSQEGNADFDAALGLLRDTIAESRRMINGLQPMLLDESGLVPAIEVLINDYFDPGLIQFEHHMRSERLSPLMEGVLFRICQEALTNATKYSQSAKIIVRITQQHGWVRLEVIDDGIGFDPSQAAAANSFGLRGIRERARLLGGHAMIDSAPGHGTRVAVELPITEV